jgi:monofunctional biosynthetic peptidoglycan transglycosylase
MRWRRRLLAATEIAVIVIALGGLGLWCSVPNTAPLADENPTSTAFIDLRRDEGGAKFKLQWQWVRIGHISRYLRAAVVYAEDYHFYTHDGVDWEAIEGAVEKDLGNFQLRVGGSTITQQLAKNLYLSPNKSFFRKLREMLIAFSLEDHLTKTRILELYLNVVEWGDGIFGAEAASRHWFGHSAASLSPAEAARLAIALPNPIERAPNVHREELTQKAVRIIRLFRMQGLIDAAQERTALDEVGAPGEKVLPDHSTKPIASPNPAPVPAPPVDHPHEQPQPEPTAPPPSEPPPSAAPSPPTAPPSPPTAPPSPPTAPPSAPESPGPVTQPEGTP